VLMREITEILSASKGQGWVLEPEANVMELEASVDSIDLNPVICSSTRCVIADARIILHKVE